MRNWGIAGAPRPQFPNFAFLPPSQAKRWEGARGMGEQIEVRVTMKTIRLTTAQALIRFLKNQYVERDSQQNRFFAEYGASLDMGTWLVLGKRSCRTRIFPSTLPATSKPRSIWPVHSQR